MRKINTMKNVFSLFLKTLNLSPLSISLFVFILIPQINSLEALNFYHNGQGSYENDEPINDHGNAVFESSTNLGEYDYSTDPNNVLSDSNAVIYIDGYQGYYRDQILPANLIAWVEDGGRLWLNDTDATANNNQAFRQFIPNDNLHDYARNVVLSDELRGIDRSGYEILSQGWVGTSFSHTKFSLNTGLIMGENLNTLITTTDGNYGVLIEFELGMGSVLMSGFTSSSYIWPSDSQRSSTSAEPLWRNILRYIRDIELDYDGDGVGDNADPFPNDALELQKLGPDDFQPKADLGWIEVSIATTPQGVRPGIWHPIEEGLAVWFAFDDSWSYTNEYNWNQQNQTSTSLGNVGQWSHFKTSNPNLYTCKFEWSQGTTGYGFTYDGRIDLDGDGNQDAAQIKSGLQFPAEDSSLDLNNILNTLSENLDLFVFPPVIQMSNSYDVGENMSLTIDPVISSGFPENYTYQWYYEGFPIPPMFGGTGDSYTLTGDITLQGNWKLDITNEAGTTSKNFSVIIRSDSDGDGIFDYKETNTGIWISENDTGTDPNNPDTDSDTYNDKDDLFPLDPNEWLDSDSDGVGDNADAFPSNPNETVDTDGDGIGNNTDTDDDGDSLTDTKESEFGTNPLVQDDFNSLIQLINSEDFSPRIEQSLYDSIVTQKDDAISRKNTLQASLDVYDNYTIPRIDINEVLTTWLGYTYDPIDDVHKVDPSVDVDQNKLLYLEHFRGILDSGPLSDEIKEDVILGLRVAINHKISREYWKARAKSLHSQAQYDAVIAERDQARNERDARPTQADIDAIIAERDAASNGLTSGHIPDSLSGLIEVYSWQEYDSNGLPRADQFGTNAVYYPNETVLQFSDGTSISSGNYSWDKDTQTVTGVDETYSYTIIYEFFETSNTSIYMFNYKSYLSNLYDETQTELTDEGFGFMYDSEGDLNQNTVSDRIDFIGQSYFPDGNFDIYLTDKTTIISNQVPDSLPQLRTLNMYSLDEIQNLSLGSATMEIINGANTLLSSEIKEKNAQGNWTDIVPISEQIPMEQNEDKKFYRLKMSDELSGSDNAAAVTNANILVLNNSNHNSNYFEYGISESFPSSNITVDTFNSLPSQGLNNYDLIVLATHGRNVDQNYENYNFFPWSTLPENIHYWLLNGGTLFINDDTHSDFNLFGILNIKLQVVDSGVNILDQNIYNGSFGSIPQNNWTGNFFSHNVILSVNAGDTLHSMIEDQSGNTIVGSVAYGNGKIIYAGMTGINFQGGTVAYDAEILWNNLIGLSIE